MVNAPLRRLASRSGVSSRARGGSHRNSFVIGSRPAPGPRTVAALDHSLLVDLRDDLAVSGEQRFGGAHLGAQRQFALGNTVGAVFLEFLAAAGGLRAAAAGAIGAFVHLAARAEVADARVLRGAKRAGVKAVAATDAQILRMQHDAVRVRKDAADRTNGCTG